MMLSLVKLCVSDQFQMKIPSQKLSVQPGESTLPHCIFSTSSLLWKVLLMLIMETAVLCLKIFLASSPYHMPGMKLMLKLSDLFRRRLLPNLHLLP